MKQLKTIGYFIIYLLWASTGLGQSLSSTNFNYLYNPLNEVSFQHQVVKEKDGVAVYYIFSATSTLSIDEYNIQWERRDSFSSRTGQPIAPIDSTILNKEGKIVMGKLTFSMPLAKWYLLATVTEKSNAGRWTYFIMVDPDYPVDGLIQTDKPILDPFQSINKPMTFSAKDPNQPLYGYFYKTEFSSAIPPFIINKVAADRFLIADSTFSIRPNDPITLSKQGLYLMQQDTLAAAGFSFRITTEAFPKYILVKDLIDPLIYITTQEEFIKLAQTNGEKSKFDQIILDITIDPDRARNFIRSYYRKVEYVNRIFSSYKEGWKTDRGMIYLIYGLPDEVVFGEGTESWFYKASKLKFNFVKSGTVYDPDNYVLVRDKDYARSWYQTVDLWRKSRF